MERILKQPCRIDKKERKHLMHNTVWGKDALGFKNSSLKWLAYIKMQKDITSKKRKQFLQQSGQVPYCVYPCGVEDNLQRSMVSFHPVDLGFELWSSGFAASSFTYWTIFLAQYFKGIENEWDVESGSGWCERIKSKLKRCLFTEA